MLTAEPEYRLGIEHANEFELSSKAGWNVAACRISHILGLIVLLAALGFVLLG